MTMHVHAWRGTIGAQDRAGYGATRALRNRGDATTAGRGDVWRISDLRSFGRNVVPGDIAQRLRAFDRSRLSGTGNACPGDSEWHAPRFAVTLDRGRWSKQRWHTVVLPNTAGLR